jgi:hypothetical protein
VLITENAFYVFFKEKQVSPATLPEDSPAPPGFANHQRRHLLRLSPLIALIDTASITRIPADVEQLDIQRQFVFL